MTFNINSIPVELRERVQWVIWRFEEREGKTTKVPYRAAGGGRASTTDPATWATFEQAVAAARDADGIGYVFSASDPYVGVDLDGGLPDADAGAIMSMLSSYSEHSVSGTGVHVIVRASLNGHPRNRKGPIEIYAAGRYFVVTGNHVVGTPTTIENRQAKLDEVLAHYLPAPEVSTRVEEPAQPVDLDDRDLIDRALAAQNGEKFRELFNGEWEHRYRSQSEADLALCSALAFWTGRDHDRIDRLFRESLLYREKWERDDYREPTIATAIVGCADVYTERTQGQKSVDSEAKKTASLTETDRNGLTDSAFKKSVRPESVPYRDRQKAGTDSDPESEAHSERPFSLPIRAFISREREQREPLLANDDGKAVVGRRSLTLLGALGGAGKTTWAIDAFMHMAAGVDFPPFTVPRPVSILMIENEGPEELFSEKLENRLESFPHELKAALDVCVYDWGGFSLADSVTKDRLIREIAENNYDLIFGDPLDSLGIEGVGSPEDTRKFLQLMKETGLNKNVAWWLNTHPRKEETKEALNEIAGSWGGKPDTVFLLKMLDDDRTQIRQPKLRWAKRGKGPTLLFAFDPETEAFTFISEEIDVERDYVAEIAKLFEDGKWRIVKEIAAPTKDGGIGANADTVKKVMEEHPDRFESRTGEEAKALGRSSLATVWGHRPAPVSEDAEHEVAA